MLFPKVLQSRKPAVDGPTENVELFVKAMTLITQLKVHTIILCHTLTHCTPSGGS